MAMVGFRDWAKQKGINPSDIVYDPVTKKVKVNGFDYGTAKPTYQTQYNAQQLSDLTRNYVPKTVQTGALADSYQLDDAYQRQGVQQAEQKKLQALTNYEKLLSKPYQPGQFTYNQVNDVGYQSALQQAQDNIKRQQMSTLEQMNARGLADSSYYRDRANQIATDEQARIATQVAPQLENQAYNRFLQQEQQKYNSWQDMVKLANSRLDLSQGVFNEKNNALLQAQQAREAKASALSNMYDTTVTPTLNPSDMYSQVKGLQTVTQKEAQNKQTQETNRLKTQVDVANIKATTEKQISDAKLADAKAAREAEAKAKAELERLKLQNNLKLEEIRNRNKNAGGGSGGGSGGGANSKGFSIDEVKKIVDTINKSTYIQRTENPDTGEIKETVTNKPAIKKLIDTSTKSGESRKYLYSQYGIGTSWFSNNETWTRSNNKDAVKQQIADYVVENYSDKGEQIRVLEEMLIWYGLR